MPGILDGVGQAVGDVGKGLGDALGGNDAVSASASATLDNVNQAAGDILPTLSLPPILPSLSDPSLPSQTPSASLTLSSSSSATTDVSQSLSASSISTSSLPSSASSISSSSSVITSSSSSTPTAISTSSSSDPPAATPAADQQTTTSFSTVLAGSSSALVSDAAATKAPAPTAFLQNKPLAGAVLGLAGLVGLVLLFIIATWALRRRKRSRLMDEAISFEPTAQHSYVEDMERLNEKGASNESYSRSYGTAPTGYYTGGTQPQQVYNQQYTPPSQLVYGGGYSA